MTIEMEVSRTVCCGNVSTTVLDGDFNKTKKIVRDKYRQAAENGGLGGSGCGCGCSEKESNYTMTDVSYERKGGYVVEADLGLGCGIPTDLAGIKKGDRVLDLGSGAGIDVFIARDIVGESGSVTGVDFTPEMIALARANTQKLGFNNVTFKKGDIEALPLSDGSIDVVVSNCVLNLVPDKDAAFSEMWRVISPGGHFCVSDIVTRGLLPDAVRRSAELYAGCVAGALDENDYLRKLEKAGFENVTVLREHKIQIPASILQRVVGDQGVSDLSRQMVESSIVSITVRGDKPSV